MQDVVILAAGLGTRLGPVAKGLPKALVRVGGTALVDYAVDFAHALTCGEGNVFVVGGYQFDRLRRHKTTDLKRSYELLENKSFRLGNLFSLMCALPHLERSFFLLNADHIFSPSDAWRFRGQSRVTVFSDDERELGDDDMKVCVDREGVVMAMDKTLASFQHGYIGVTYVPELDLMRYRESCEAVAKDDPPRATVERVIQHLCDRGARIPCHKVGVIRWFEIDTPLDFERAEACLKMSRVNSKD
jgi:Predicted sugar nucleotidyltransferases